jgi:AraC-like DNA-binding protein
MLTAYYISTLLLSALLAFAIGYESWLSRGIGDAALRLRRNSFMVLFSLFLLATVSRLFIVENGQVEVSPSLTICLDYASFVAFTMMACAYFGRRYHLNPYNWFFMLQTPLLFILLNLLMRVSGYYQPLYGYGGLAQTVGEGSRVVFLGRIVFTAFIFMTYAFLIAVLFLAYWADRRKWGRRISDLEYRQNFHERGNILLYMIILVLTLISNFAGSLLFHVLCNVAMTVMIAWSMRVFTQFTKYTRMKLDGSFKPFIIKSQLSKVIHQVEHNPLYTSNPLLDDIARFLKVSHDELSNYIYNELHTTFSSWVNEKRLYLCIYLLRTTDYKIADIASAAGYKNVTALNKAFKTAHGMTPKEYRNCNPKASQG